MRSGETVESGHNQMITMLKWPNSGHLNVFYIIVDRFCVR